MGTTTFSGPIKAGTTTANVGRVLMASESFTMPLAGVAGVSTVTDVIIPANSQIIDIIVDSLVGPIANNVTIDIGDTVGGQDTFINDLFIGNAFKGRVGWSAGISATDVSGTELWTNTGPLDKQITYRHVSGATNPGGRIKFTFLYLQNNKAVDIA